MAKDYQRGVDWYLYLDTADNWSTPTWVRVDAVEDIDVADNADDIAAPVRGLATGHLKGHNDPSITFTLHVDRGDTDVETLITRMGTGAKTHIAVGNTADITVSDASVYYHIEAVLMGRELTAPMSGVSSLSVRAFRHLNSDYDLTRATT